MPPQQLSQHVHAVRTQVDELMLAAVVLLKLKDGNVRYVEDEEEEMDSEDWVQELDAALNMEEDMEEDEEEEEEDEEEEKFGPHGNEQPRTPPMFDRYTQWEFKANYGWCFWV